MKTTGSQDVTMLVSTFEFGSNSSMTLVEVERTSWNEYPDRLDSGFRRIEKKSSPG